MEAAFLVVLLERERREADRVPSSRDPSSTISRTGRTCLAPALPDMMRADYSFPGPP